MSYYIIIRGPLGSGKSTISEKLAQKLDAKHFEMDEILEKHGLDKIPPGEPCISVENFIKANEIVLPEVKKLLAAGQIVIFDACFYHKEVVEHLIQSLRMPHYIFTLEAPLRVCIKRDSERDNPHGEDSAHAVYSLVSRFDRGNIINAAGSIDETLADIVSHLPSE